jgi:pentatricopeptide repeat protein
MAHLFLHQWDVAIGWLRRSLTNNRNFAPTYRFLAVALVQSGRLEEAHRVIQEMATLDPLSSIQRARITGFRDEEPKRLYIESLRGAGLPE